VKKAKVTRLFIDPASKSTGWALFRDKKFDVSGTIQAEANLPAFERLWQLQCSYEFLKEMFKGEIDEVHIEKMVAKTAIECKWSVGVIGSVFGCIAHVDDGVPIQSWQKFCDWKGDRQKLRRYYKRVHSEDELAAIGMGLWYVKERVK
jgi:hypothetical protein